MTNRDWFTIVAVSFASLVALIAWPVVGERLARFGEVDPAPNTQFRTQLVQWGCTVQDPCPVSHRVTSDGFTMVRVQPWTLDQEASLMLSQEVYRGSMRLVLRRFQGTLKTGETPLSADDPLLGFIDYARDEACSAAHPCQAFVGPEGLGLKTAP